MRTLRESIRSIILENLETYQTSLDATLDHLNASLKDLESAHEEAPDEEAKAILMGVHSDLYNQLGDVRKYIRKLKNFS